MGSEWLERRDLMHGGHGPEPFPPGADLHATLNMIIDGQQQTIPANVGATAGGGDLANPHTHAADNVLHMHALNGVDPTQTFTIGEFFNVWRTNAGAAGNNPSATFSSTQLMGRIADGNNQVHMYVNGAPVNEFENYAMHNEDDIRLTYGPQSNPTLAPIDNVTVKAGAPLNIPLDGFDANGDALNFSISSTNPALTGALTSAINRSLKISVTHQSSGPNDPAFSGDMILELFEDLAPRTTGHMIQLAESGFFNNVIFHRVIDTFMIQGGDPTGTGTGGSNLGDFDDEYNPALQHTGRGLLSMAKSSDDTNDSQFFVTEAPTRSLDFQHSVFGQLIEGENIRQAISNVATDEDDRPLTEVKMTSVTVYQDYQNGVLRLSAPSGATGQADVTVTASDGFGGTTTRTFHVTIVADDPAAQNGVAPPYLPQIPDLETTVNTPFTYQIPYVDIEFPANTDLPVKYLGHDELNSIFPPNGTDQQRERSGFVPINPNLDVDVDFDTGLMTVTPHAGIVGVQYVYIGVARNTRNVDTQQVPVLIAPQAPTTISLAPQSDTGASSTDHITHNNNSDANSRLSFIVDGVRPGTQVELYDGSVLIGSASAIGTSVTVQTNGSTVLSNGAHSITAKQVLKNQTLDVGNRQELIDIPSDESAPVQITIGNDFHNPNISQDADANGGIQALDVLVIVNYLNANPNPDTPINSNFYLDVSNDGTVSALDVLQVVNYLNTHPSLTALSAQGLNSNQLIAQALAAPSNEAEVTPQRSTNENAPGVTQEISHYALSAGSETDITTAESFADDFSVSPAEKADLDELIELLATAR